MLALVIGFGATEVDTANWSAYVPFGFEGVLGGAGLMLFAYIGFDVVATTAEESGNPLRDMPRGISGSLAIVTGIYFAVALVITGMVPFRELAG